MEEQDFDNQNKKNNSKSNSKNANGTTGHMRKASSSLGGNNQQQQVSDSESTRSMDEPPKDYEIMLQKYEAEVRNHIKIEQ